jgi:ADP-heptose:LPS heptosyltransferase
MACGGANAGLAPDTVVRALTVWSCPQEMSAPQATRRVLVYSGGEIMGDGLNKLAFLRALRRAWPDAHVTWFAGNGASVYARKLAPAVDGLIDELIESHRGAERWSNLLWPRLRGRQFDVIVDTQLKLRATAELKRVAHGLLVSAAANGLLSERRAPGQPWRAARPANLGRQLLQLLALARHGRADGAVDPSGGVAVPERCVRAAERLMPQAPAIALAPGAGGAAKRWPLASFSALGERLAGDGYTPLYLLGPDESDMLSRLQAAVPSARFPLQEAGADALADEPFLTMAIAARCRAAVANDSGIGHIIAATGVAMATLFGPTNAAKFAPSNPNAVCVRAQDYGGETMSAIPVEAVRACLRDRHGV